MNRAVVVMYAPVIHEGYIRFLGAYPETRVYLIPKSLSRLDYLRKDIRAVDVSLVSRMLEAVFPGRYVGELGAESIRYILESGAEIIMPDDDISREIALEFPAERIRFESVFLRWDPSRLEMQSAVAPDQTISERRFGKWMLKMAEEEAKTSPDWWLQVGVVIFDDVDRILFSGHNTHLPSENAPYVLGDMRMFSSRGVGIEVTSAIHGEALGIATCANEGISLHGKSILTTVFPCPPCAKLIVAAGFRRCYYRSGYSLRDGEMVLRSGGVTIVQILPDPSE